MDATTTGITRTYLRLTQTIHPYMEQNLYPTPRKSSNKLISCPMLRCNFFCHLEREYKTHVETAHYCEDCTLYCSSLSKHHCSRPNQRGGHLDLTKIDQSVFKETTRSHMGVLV
ncbi:unnamed protein product, partial [Allacma fusca]